jgi:hypothetical protein
MQDIMTITLSDSEPRQASGGEYTVGHQATIFFEEDNGIYGYRYHGVRHGGVYYEGESVTGFETRQAALKAAVEGYSKGLGC